MEREQIKKALECCGAKGSPNCKECPMEEGKGCAVRLYREALAYINKRETEFNELYELCESYRIENESIRRRMHHLFQSKFISSFDEVDRKTKEYKRDIAEADKLTK